MTKRKINKKEKNEALNFIISFCENRISFNEFWVIFTQKHHVRELLLNDMSNFHIYTFRHYILDLDHIKTIDVSNIEIRLTIFRFLRNYLKSKNIDFCPFSPDEEIYNSICSVIPDWLEGQELNYFIKLFHLSDGIYISNELKETFKRKIRDSFIYIDKPPKWLQSSEWPILNGVPMIFLNQSDEPDNPELESSSITYTFVSNDKKEEKKVIQFD